MYEKYKNKQWLIERYINENLSCREIAEIIGCCSSTIKNWLKYYDIKARRGAPKGKKHPRWNGGKKMQDGYVKILNPERTNANDFYILEHRDIMEKKLGRKLNDDEIVHHIDGNKLNNSPNNLKVFSREEHNEINANVFSLAFSMFYEAIKEGDITFNHNTNRYEKNVKKPDRKKYYFFCGRWSPFHEGHKYIIDSFVNNGKPVCIAIRDTEISEKNPYTPELRKKMIEEVYKDNPLVKVIVIPDIEGVCVGRGVGYFIMEVPQKIEKISATNIRAGKSFDMPDEVKKVLGDDNRH